MRGDLTRSKGEMAQFLQGTAQYFQTMTPIVQAGGAELAEPVIGLFAPFARMFSLGKQGEDALEYMIEIARNIAQQPQGPSPQEQMAMMAQQQDMQIKERKQAVDEKKVNIDMFRARTDAAAKGAKARTDQERTDIEGISRAAEIELETVQQRPVRIE